MKYVAGWDGGGTKTAVTVADENGRSIHAFTAGAINYNGQDEESVRLAIQEIIASIERSCGGLERCAQMCIGAAGVSNPSVVSRLTSNIRECGYEGRLLITGDHETALYGGLDNPYGIILIAGTGSICYGKNEAGAAHRTGGCGYLIDDEGSGYSIGRDLIAAVVRANDGRIPETAIAGLVYDRLQVGTVRELIGFVHDKRTNKKDVAALAPLLSEACSLGDEAGLAIADKSASSLLELVVPVADKLVLQDGNLAMSGSVLLRNDYVRTAFADKLERAYPRMNCFPAKKDASSGAVLLALNLLRSE